MPLRVLRLLNFPTNPETALATSLSFAATLQFAAGRAWIRRVVAHTQPKDAGTRGVHTTRNHHHRMAGKVADRDVSVRAGPSTGKRKESKSAHKIPGMSSKKSSDAVIPRKLTQSERHFEKSLMNVTYFDPTANVYEPSTTEIMEHASPREVNSYDISSEHLPSVSNSVNAESFPLEYPSSLPTPNCRASLHRNLLYALNYSKPSPGLSMLVHYHSHYPEWQSTPSYNLLISLAIRHQDYGTLFRLFNELEAARLPRDLDTYMLEVRALVHRGMWEKAWKYVQNLKEDGVLPRADEDETGIPLRIWLEFCRPIRTHQTRRRSVYDEDGRLLHKFFEKVTESPEELKVHQQLLNKSRPKNMPTLDKTHPYAIYCIVQLLARSGDYKRALDLTRAFLSAIPRSLSNSHIRRCLDIIHVHMHFEPAKDGLPRFYQARRTMVSLLKLHRNLRPNSKTLSLLLAPLQRAKKCGTIAWKTLKSFKSEWGSLVEDERVRRRVANLALKEGRMDIVNKMTMKETNIRRYRHRRVIKDPMFRSVWPVSTRWNMQLPNRIIYPRNGKEARLWYRLRTRIRVKVYQRKQRQQLLELTKNMSHSSEPPILPTP